MMIPTQLDVEPNQEKRIINAYRRRRGCRLKVRKGASTSHHHGEMLLSPQQWMKYQALAHGKSMSVPFSHKELEENMKHRTQDTEVVDSTTETHKSSYDSTNSY